MHSAFKPVCGERRTTHSCFNHYKRRSENEQHSWLQLPPDTDQPHDETMTIRRDTSAEHCTRHQPYHGDAPLKSSKLQGLHVSDRHSRIAYWRAHQLPVRLQVARLHKIRRGQLLSTGWKSQWRRHVISATWSATRDQRHVNSNGRGRS